MAQNNVDYGQINLIKEKIQLIKKDSDIIHVTVNNKKNAPIDAISKILTIHDRFFYIETRINNYFEKSSINYIDILIKII